MIYFHGPFSVAMLSQSSLLHPPGDWSYFFSLGLNQLNNGEVTQQKTMEVWGRNNKIWGLITEASTMVFRPPDLVLWRRIDRREVECFLPAIFIHSFPDSCDTCHLRILCKGQFRAKHDNMPWGCVKSQNQLSIIYILYVWAWKIVNALSWC